MKHLIRIRYSQVALNEIFFDSRCAGEWRKINATVAWNPYGQVVAFAPADVVSVL